MVRVQNFLRRWLHSSLARALRAWLGVYHEKLRKKRRMAEIGKKWRSPAARPFGTWKGKWVAAVEKRAREKRVRLPSFLHSHFPALHSPRRQLQLTITVDNSTGGRGGIRTRWKVGILTFRNDRYMNSYMCTYMLKEPLFERTPPAFDSTALNLLVRQYG